MLEMMKICAVNNCTTTPEGFTTTVEANADDRLWGLDSDVRKVVNALNKASKAAYYQSIMASDWTDIEDIIASDCGYARYTLTWKSDKDDKSKRQYWHLDEHFTKWSFDDWFATCLSPMQAQESAKVLQQMHILCVAVHMGELSVNKAAKEWHNLTTDLAGACGIPFEDLRIDNKVVLREMAAGVLSFTDDKVKTESYTQFMKSLSIFIRRSIKSGINLALEMSGDYKSGYKAMIDRVREMDMQPTNMLSVVDVAEA